MNDKVQNKRGEEKTSADGENPTTHPQNPTTHGENPSANAEKQIIALKDIQRRLTGLQHHIISQTSKESHNDEASQKNKNDLDKLAKDLTTMIQDVIAEEEKNVINTSKGEIGVLQKEIVTSNESKNTSNESKNTSNESSTPSAPEYSVDDLYTQLYRVREEAMTIIAAYNKTKTANEYEDLVLGRKDEFAQKPGIMAKVFRYLSQKFS